MSRNRGGLRPSKRNTVFHRDLFACRYCGAEPPISELTLDHVIPFSEGGANANDNLVTCCSPCNIEKKTTYWEPKPIGYFKAPNNTPFAALLIEKGFANV